jgi:hypothetical protein
MPMPNMGKMIGPLPLGAWLVVVAGGAGIALYTRRQNTPAVVDPSLDNSGADPRVGDGSVSSWIQTQPPGTTTTPAITDNESWGTAAIRYLIAKGYDPATSDSAIRKYLDQGSAFSAQEFALVNIALGGIGPPPVPLPSPVFRPPTMPVPKPPAKPVPKPPPVPRPGPGPKPKPKPIVKKPQKPKPVSKPHVRYYRVVRGDTLYGIAKHFYHNGNQWSRIYAANRAGHTRADRSPGMISNPSRIQVGWNLIIP